MPVSKFNSYLQLINVITAEEAMLEINIASFPHSKKEFGRKFTQQLKRVYNQVVEPRPGSGKVMNIAEVAKTLAGKLYGRRED